MLHNHIPDVHRGRDLADLVGAGCDLRGGTILRPLLWPIHPPTRQIHTNRRGQTSLAKSSSLPGVSISLLSHQESIYQFCSVSFSKSRISVKKRVFTRFVLLILDCVLHNLLARDTPDGDLVFLKFRNQREGSLRALEGRCVSTN